MHRQMFHIFKEVREGGGSLMKAFEDTTIELLQMQYIQDTRSHTTI